MSNDRPGTENSSDPDKAEEAKRAEDDDELDVPGLPDGESGEPVTESGGPMPL